MHHVGALGHPTEHRVLPVQPRRGDCGDEKLRSVCVWSRVGHGDCVRAIVPQVPRDLVLELPAPDGDAPGTVPERVPGLQHEPLDDAVEDDVVVVPVSAVRGEVLARLRARIREHLDVNIADGGVNDRRAGQGRRCGRHEGRGAHPLIREGLLVEHVPSPRRVVAILGLPRGEQVQPGLVERAAHQRGVLLGRLLRVLAAAPRAFVLLRHPLEHRQPHEPLRVLNLADDPGASARDQVDNLHAEQRGVQQKVSGLVKHGVWEPNLYIRVVTHLPFHRQPPAKVDIFELVRVGTRALDVVGRLERLVDDAP